MTRPRDLTPDDLPAVDSIMGDAFSGDPVIVWIAGERQIAGPLFAAAAKQTFLPYGFGHILSGGEGAALWMPPGAKDESGFAGLASMMMAILMAGGPKAVWRGKVLDDYLAAHHPKEPHYYLAAIGVRHGFQGRGLGKALMNPVLAKADAEGMPAYLESSKPENVPIYRSVGFEVTQELICRPDAPTLYAMWREPKG